MILPWILCALLLIAVIYLIIKIYFMHKSMNEISLEVNRFLNQDTNVLISISSKDKYIRRLAENMNVQLKELRKLRRQYENGDKELKEAVTNISHDLRTPITAIWGYLDLIEREEKSKDITRYIEQIRERTETLKSLTEELFAYSVIASVPELKYEEVNVNRVLEETLLSFFGEFEKVGIKPSINICAKLNTLRGDEAALARVFGNIISNAIKYSDGDFFVEMSEDRKIVFSNTSKKLSSVEVAKLFDRFYTVSQNRKSTGLGLSIAKLLVERMNGKIDAFYEESKLYITIEF